MSLSGTGPSLSLNSTTISPSLQTSLSSFSINSTSVSPSPRTSLSSFSSNLSSAPLSLQTGLNSTTAPPYLHTGLSTSRSFLSSGAVGNVTQTGNLTASPTTTFTSSSTDADPYCIPFQDPDSRVNGTYCQCNNGGFYSLATGSNLCPYTSTPPASLSVQTPLPTLPVPIPTNCQNGLNPDELCWNALNLTNYINDWWNINQGKCGNYGGFADCWYALKTIYAPSTCNQLNTDPACKQPTWNDFKDKKNATLDFYVSWAIWNTQGLFLDLYNAVGDASGPVGNNAGAIVLALDPPKTSTSDWEYVFDALTFGLSLYSEGSVLVKALLRSAPQSSTLFGKLLFPAGSPAGEIEAWANVQQQMGNMTSLWQSSIGSGLPDLVNNVTAFTAWGDNSGITGIRPPLNGLTTSISQSLGAYMSAAIINQIGLVVTRAESLSVVNLQNTQKLNWDTGCGGGYDSNGLCHAYYFDGTDTYSISDPNNMQKDFSDLFQQLMGGSNPLTTGNLLFTNGHQCASTCGSNGGCNPSLGSDPTVAPSCISGVRVCTWTWADFGPFQECSNLPNKDAVLPEFCVTPCIGSDGFMDCSVPLTYLGGGVVESDLAPGAWHNWGVCNTGY